MPKEKPKPVLFNVMSKVLQYLASNSKFTTRGGIRARNRILEKTEYVRKKTKYRSLKVT